LLPNVFELSTQTSAPAPDHAAHSNLGLGLTLVKSFDRVTPVLMTALNAMMPLRG
jgi:hypothetical protein